ncbi:hypothetical protein NON20_22905 [Synechocystis sp. B12]|nr:hypothetical protein NON20_22905 [Synechocystis sp. B12]
MVRRLQGGEEFGQIYRHYCYRLIQRRRYRQIRIQSKYQLPDLVLKSIYSLVLR